MFNQFVRAYEPLENSLHPNKVLVVYGARRVGKTTLWGKTYTNTTFETIHLLNYQNFILPQL